VSDDSAQQPAGAAIKTLLVSDLVNSTKLVESLGDARAFEIFGLHDRVARDLLQEHNGREIDKTDGFLLLFERPIDAVGYATAYHQALLSLSEQQGVTIASRVGIHLGEVYLRENRPEDVARGAKPLEVEGLAKPMTARLMSVAQASQTLLTRGAFDLARRAAAGVETALELQWLAHGAYRFKGVDEPVKVFEVGDPNVSPLSPPPSSEKVKRVEDETILGWRPAPGQEVPHRPHWQLESKLGEGGFGEVWLAEHRKTRDQRVYKFCFDVERLKGLQREVTLFRLLKETLGARDDIARILDWSFESAPYFIESTYTEGGSLLDWSARQEGIAEVPIEVRLELAAQTADALAAAHSVGVLHKDLKPANILIATDRQGHPQAQLTDFGIGLVTDRERLSQAGITVLGFDETVLEDASSMTGTQLYMAPELLEGKPATTQADIFALGVLLYQLVVGNFTHALAPGWEREIDDELLRQDIAELVDGDPLRRLGDASQAANRLRTLEQRHRELEEKRREAAEAEQARAALERSRKRRKLVAAAVAVLSVFSISVTILSFRIQHEKERAQLEAATSQEVANFLVSLFEGADPNKTRGREVTARELLDLGAERIDNELDDRPLLKARLTESLGNLYAKLGVIDTAERLFTQTIELQQEHAGAVSVSVATSLMNLANIQAQQGQFDEAKHLFSQALEVKQQALGPQHPEVADLLVNLSSLSQLQGETQHALTLVERAIGIFRSSRSSDDSKLALALVTYGRTLDEVMRYAEAEDALSEALDIISRTKGADHPDVARVLAPLAYIHETCERYDQAEQLYRRVLEIRQTALPEGHPLLAVAQRDLADVLIAQGKLDEAQPLVTQALDHAEQALGPQHGLVADILLSSAELHRRNGDLEQASRLAHRALAIVEAEEGPFSPDAALFYNCLGLILLEQGRGSEGASLLEQEIAALEQAETGEGPDLARLSESLGLTYRALGHETQARTFLERSLRIRQRLFGADHPSVLRLSKLLE